VGVPADASLAVFWSLKAGAQGEAFWQHRSLTKRLYSDLGESQKAPKMPRLSSSSRRQDLAEEK